MNDQDVVENFEDSVLSKMETLKQFINEKPLSTLDLFKWYVAYRKIGDILETVLLESAQKDYLILKHGFISEIITKKIVLGAKK